jgi:hypothetical protein
MVLYKPFNILSGRGDVGVGVLLCFLLCQRSLVCSVCVVQNNPLGSLKNEKCKDDRSYTPL